MFLRQRKASSWCAGGQSSEGETKKVCTPTTIYRHLFDTLVTLNILINTKWHFNNIEHIFINTKCVREMLSVNGNSLLTLSNFVDAKKFHKYINVLWHVARTALMVWLFNICFKFWNELVTRVSALTQNKVFLLLCKRIDFVWPNVLICYWYSSVKLYGRLLTVWYGTLVIN